MLERDRWNNSKAASGGIYGAGEEGWDGTGAVGLVMPMLHAWINGGRGEERGLGSAEKTAFLLV